MKILKANCEQMALVESMLRATGCMYIVSRGDNYRLWEIQREFKPVVEIREFELLARGIFPVKLKFEYVKLENQARLSTNRAGLEKLKELMPDVFGAISEKEGEEILEDAVFVQAAKPKAEGNIG